jgi:hypothetical protein
MRRWRSRGPARGARGDGTPLAKSDFERACLALGWIEAEEDADAPLAK